MSKFPPSIPLPKSVNENRLERRKQMMFTAQRGVILRSVIIIAELLGFVFLGSSALLLDALSSIFDVASSLFLILFIKIADKPPDRNHPFGHGRFEPIAGLQLGLLLAVLGGAMLIQQLFAISSQPQGRVIQPLTWLIPLGAVILLEISYQSLKRTAKRQNSPALLSDAVHYRVDAINSLFAMIALLFAAYFPRYSGLCDHLGAIVIAMLMIGIGVFAAKNNINQLLDRVPAQEFFDKVKTAAMRINGVLATEKIRIQLYGPDAHISIDIEVSPELSVDRAHELTQQVRAEIQKEWPAVRDVIVHVEPYYAGDH
ncbi:MAG: cation diffusion facilitator family transporter [Rhabdochlamydiaceae bacterium]|jgi:cation diffusion facilitator family transporter